MITPKCLVESSGSLIVFSTFAVTEFLYFFLWRTLKCVSLSISMKNMNYIPHENHAGYIGKNREKTSAGKENLLVKTKNVFTINYGSVILFSLD